MELRELAEAVLFSERIEDKLQSPEALSDERPGLPADALWPARPEALRLDLERERGPFPSLSALESERVRGEVLHFFANHELLAMELMALMLLRFPDAEPGWRMGLARTLLDEQRHMGIYLRRMADFGVAFGDRAPSAFFWTVLAGGPTPMDFAVGMSLTFEQANLDYCLHYGAAFRAIGDPETEQLLHEVYVDEVRHVAHGLRWFRQWKDAGESDWDAFVRLQRPPLSAARARGLGFSEQARLDAGFDASFIERLRVFSASKGRRPTVHWFNPGSEPSVGATGWSPDGVTQVLRRDLETLPMFLARGDDAVLVQDTPRAEFLNGLREAGFRIPAFVTALPEDTASVAPFAHTPESRTVLGSGLDHDRAYPRSSWADRTGAHICASVAEVEDLVQQGGRWVIKAELSSSGRGNKRVEAPLSAGVRTWIERLGVVTVEPLLDRVFDLSALYRGDRLLGITRPLCDEAGRYKGHVCGHPFPSLDVEIRRFLGGLDLRARYRTLGHAIALEGLWGIDALVHRTAQGLALREVVEVNPRTTMGHIALALNRRGIFRMVATPFQSKPGALALTDPERAQRFVAVLELE